MWHGYGLVAFLLYVGLAAAVVLAAGRRVFVQRADGLWLLTLLVGVYCIVLMAGAKAAFWPVPALAWGLLAARLNDRSA